jgi:hypothetical protein
MNSLNTRRAFIQTSAAIGTGLVLSACSREDRSQSGKQTGESGTKKEGKGRRSHGHRGSDAGTRSFTASATRLYGSGQ